MKRDDVTDFGYEQVRAQDKTARVSAVFDSVADNYDIMNDLMSLSMHRLWKRTFVHLLEIRQHYQVLDVAGGSGDITRLLAPKLKSGRVILSDINPNMLAHGRAKCENAGLLQNIQYAIANAEALPFSDNCFDRVVIAFGLRNVTDKATALASMQRVLKPGGRLAILEFSKPTGPWLEKLYDRYSFSVLPWLGKHIAKDEASYRYLAESIRKHPGQEDLKTLIESAGFDDCHYHNLCGGIVACHVAYKY